MQRSAVAALIPLVLAISACARPSLGSPETAPSGSPAVQEDSLPPGWRWESYGGVEVGVPGNWGWGGGTQRLTQWCVDARNRITEPIVGRPSGSTLVLCPAGNPDPGTLIANTGSVVAFELATEPPGLSQQGDQTAVRIDGVEVIVNAPVELRRQIVETIRPVTDVDSYGCPTTHPISTKAQHRPARPVEVTALTDVSTVSACKFPLGEDPSVTHPGLISSLRLDGSAAEQAIREIAKAPPGGGPDNPDQCLPSYTYGEDVIVLFVRSAAGRSEVVLRYSGCGHNGFDDGIAVRSLTPKAVAPFIAGPNKVNVLTGGPDKEAILWPSAASK